MHLVHGGVAGVGVKAWHALHGASEQRAKELVQMCQKEVLHGRVVIGRHVLHQGLGGTTIKEVDGHSGVASAVARGQLAGEVGEKVDVGAVEGSGSQDTGDCDADIGLGV